MYDSIWILTTHSHKDSYAALQRCFLNTFVIPLNLKARLAFVHWVIPDKFNSANVELLS